MLRSLNLNHQMISQISRTVRFNNQSAVQNAKENEFVSGPNPYETKKDQCILCKHKIKLDYKNPRLLSQFVSPLTGEIYSKNITGLCEMQQSLLVFETKKSWRAMLMPKFYKDPRFNKDPPLFNPDRPKGKTP